MVISLLSDGKGSLQALREEVVRQMRLQENYISYLVRTHARVASEIDIVTRTAAYLSGGILVSEKVCSSSSLLSSSVFT